jgi:septum formation protein
VSRILLASSSKTRLDILTNAGLDVTPSGHSVDETEAKRTLRAKGSSSRDAALGLAALKAVSVSAPCPECLVIGADQILECDGAWFDKPADLAAGRFQLTRLRGRSHRLATGIAVAEGGRVLWSHADHADLTMRTFSDAFLDDYVSRAGNAALASVGFYQAEGLGAQLFESWRGDHFTILGLPLLPLLDYLRSRGDLPR